MIAHLMLAVLFAQSDPAAAVPKCKLEGQVVSAATGAPLKHANLRLEAANTGNASPGSLVDFTSSTDAEGNFVIQGVDAGTYFLRAERVGYVAQNYGARSASMGGTRLKLDAGQSMKDLMIKLIPQAMIFGKVIDDDGEPVPGVRIQPQRWMFLNGKKELRSQGGGSSQADGTFVIGNLQAGRYFLSAVPSPGPNFGIERSGSKTPREELLTTYFPNGVDASSAAPVEVTAGAEIRGLEIHMRRGRMYQIRGHIQMTTADPAPDSVGLVIFAKGASDTFFNQRNQAYAQKAGVFQFKGVLPGTYVIQTTYAQSVSTDSATGDVKRQTTFTGRLEVNVTDSDLQNVIFPLGPGAEIAGKFKTEGDPPAQPLTQQQTPQPQTQPSVSLQTVEGIVGYGGAYAQATDEGNFWLHGVSAGVFRVNVFGNPDGTYVNAIRFGGEDITGKNLDLTSGAGGDLEILISPNAADVTGVVRNEDDDSVPGILVQAYLGDDMKRSSTTDQNGGFHLTSLAPGDYRIYAWEDIEPGLAQEPSFRKNFENRAAEVKLEEKSHESVELKVIDKDAIAAEAAKVQ